MKRASTLNASRPDEFWQPAPENYDALRIAGVRLAADLFAVGAKSNKLPHPLGKNMPAKSPNHSPRHELALNLRGMLLRIPFGAYPATGSRNRPRRNEMHKFFTFALVGLAAALMVEPAFAQLDSASKMRGEYSFRSGSASRSMRNAREYSHAYREYARTPEVQKVEPEVAKETADAIEQYIVKAQKHMAWMRKHAAGDKATLASLDLIDKNLEESAKSHKEMHEMCQQENIDAEGSMKCCERIDESLSAAIAEHDKLMKRLGLGKPAAKKK